MPDHVADELRLVDALGELGLDVVAAARAHAAEVETIRRAVDARADQPAGFDQRLDLRALDQRLEDVAQPAARPSCTASPSGRARQRLG